MNHTVYVFRGDDETHPNITMQNGFSVEIWADCKIGPAHIDVNSNNDVPNAYGEEYRGFPNGISLDVKNPDDDLDVTRTCWVARAVSEFHEVLEFTTLDGERLADPHPPNEGEMWQWLYEKIDAVAIEYMARYPYEGPPYDEA